MKIKLLVPALCLLLLAGCGGNDDVYYTSIDHSERGEVTLQGSGSEDITGYYALKGTLMNMVNMGVSEDVLRIDSYSGNLDDDLKAIIQEITTVEPIGIYGVSSISAEQARVLTYRELSIQIQYKRRPEEMQAIATVSGPYDLQNRMSDMFRDFSENKAFYIAKESDRPEDLEGCLYAAWMKCGGAAVGLNRAYFELYPEQGENCVLEITASYSYEKERLEEMARFVSDSAAKICEGMEGRGVTEKIRFVENYLSSHTKYDYNARRVVNETRGGQPKSEIYTAYGVFSGGVGAQSGLVLAASAMLDAMGVDHTVETGLVGEDIYSWLTVSVDGQEYIFDVTAARNGRDSYLISKSEGELYEAW